mmetsp:Transcript_1150/g.1775  ORF Transcript_1150/g.1775 Transcript_1150/m.1775 type:complete len:283 (+) Transcript_1150:72-920(+)
MAEFRNAFAALDSASDGEGPAKPIATKKQADIDRSKQLRKSTNVRKGKEAKHNAVAPKAASKGGDHSGNHHKRAPRREHDRRSGTGRGREGKKGGAGGHNWGKPGDDAAQEPASVDPVDGEEAQATEEVEPAVKELTLEDYEAERAAKRQGELFSRVSVRKGDAITEGVAYAKKKAADLENDAFIAMGEKKDKKKRERNQNKKKVLQTNFSIRDESAPSSDFGERRGGRGGARGGRGGRGGARGGRGGARGGAPRGRGGRGTVALDPTDASSFPSLSTVAQQ